MVRAAMTVLLLTLPGGMLAASAEDAEKDLRQTNAAYDQALVRSDATALQGIYSDDFTYTTLDGELRDREAQLGFVRAGKLRLVSGGSDDVRVRVYGDFAVLTGRFTGELSTQGGKVTVRERYTTAWARRSGRWFLLAEQGTAIK